MENIFRILKMSLKLWLHVLIHIVVFICVSNVVQAAPSAQDLYDFYQNNFYEVTGFNTTIEQWNNFVSVSGYSSNEKVYMGIKKFDSTNSQILVFGCASDQTVSVSSNVNGAFLVDAGTMNVYYFQTNSGNFSYNQATASTSGGQGGNYLKEVMVLDFTNLTYDPSIPTPIFSVYYNDDSSSLPRFNADIQLQNASEEYFAYVIMDNSTPIRYGIAYDGNMYNVSYNKFATREIVSMQSLTRSDTLTIGVLSGLVSSGWRADINTIDDSDVEINAISDGAYWTDSSPAFIAMRTQLLNLRKIALFYGNSNTISVQYFRVEGDKIYAGEIKSWNNLNGGVFTMSIPKYYIPNTPANGFEVVTIDRPLETANPMTTIPDNQFGYRTGGDITINIGSNVPNYPDYPTIATYNLDNILVSTIDNAKNLGSFFTDVSAFCAATFSWIPREIWQIIALGFALSIVVMFVKIL